jgi:ferric-dicitrate binding protein FerR (iron transport regulator)
MQKDFNALFQKWRSQEASDGEINELREMLKSVTYQNKLKNALSDASVSGSYDHEIIDKRKSTLLEEVMDEIERKKSSHIKAHRLRIASAAAAAIILVVLAGRWIIDSWAVDPKEELASVQVVDKHFIKLPDGTAVTLNEGSTITYNTDEFGKGTREVSLSGEAFFDVTHAPDRPFIVNTQHVSTTVLGTAFNVNAYANKPIVVTVVRGKVKVGSADKVFETLLPDQELVIEPRTLVCERANVHSAEKIEWMTSYLILDNVTMKEAAQMISKRYNTHVVLEDSSLAQCRISIFFVKNESLSRVLETVSLAKGGDYAIKNNIATINGKCE